MNRLQPFLIAGMMMCFSIPLIILGEALLPDWQGGYILLVTPLTVLEGIWSKRIYQRERLSGSILLWRLAAEAMVLILLVKLLSYSSQGFQRLLVDLKIWVREPATFFTLELIVVSLFAVGVWLISQSLQTSLDRIADPVESGLERQLAREQIRGFILAGGLWLLSLSGLIFGLSDPYLSLSDRDLNSVEAGVIGYFGLSLLLLAHIQYLRRKMEWQLEGLVVPEVVTRRWVRWGFLLTAGVFLIAVFLPAAYSLGPGKLLRWIFNLLYYIGQLVTFFIFILLSPLIWLLAQLGGEESIPSQPALDFPELLEPSVSHVPVWWQYMRQVLQFVFVLVVLGVVFYTYAKNREIKLPRIGEVLTRFLQMIHNIWAWFQRMRVGARQRFREFRMHRVPSKSIQEQAPRRFSLLQARTPRARVRRYYLALLRRAAELGLQRDPQQTAHEYADDLAHKVPEGQIELATLTDAFVHARYDAKEVAAESVPPVRKAWHRIRNMLRNLGGR